MKLNRGLVMVVLLCIAVLIVIFQKNLLESPSGNTSHSSDKGNKIQVIASFYPLYYFSNEIGGEMVQVRAFTPVGIEPHDYEPTTADIAGLEKSNMLIINGGVETWAEKIKENLKGTEVVIVVAGEGIMNLQTQEDGETIVDPHIWLSPQLAKNQISRIAQGFMKVDPQNSSYYESNEKNLSDRLNQIDQKFKQGLSNCNQKDFITSHAAFGYLAKGYDLNQVPIAGLSPNAEPSLQELTEIVKFAKSKGIKYIFTERLVSPKLTDIIAHEIGIETLVLDPLEGLSDDDMRNGKNYFTLMEENLKNLQKALQCNT